MTYTIIETCIGCTACTKKCPVEAITGLRDELHVIDPELPSHRHQAQAAGGAQDPPRIRAMITGQIAVPEE